MKVALVGAAPSSQMLAPFDDEEWEIWVLGNQLGCYKDKRFNRVFEIHDDLSASPQGYADWLVSMAGTVLVVGDKFPIYGNEQYPYDAVNALLGGEHLSSSAAYMIGYALLNPDLTDIGIYGFDMAVDDLEYFKQRPDMYAWIGYAKAKGINVIIPDEAAIFKSTYNEGRDWGSGSYADSGIKPFTRAEFDGLAKIHANRILEIKKQIKRLKREADTRYGCQQVYENMSNVSRAIESGATVTSLSDVTSQT